MNIIDSHNHFWEFDEREHSWMEGEFAPLRRNFMPEDFEPLLQQSGVNGTIVVQARESVEETRWLLELAGKHSCIKGVVGWIDLFADDAAEVIQNFASNTALVGLRNVFQGKGSAQLLDETFIRNMDLLKEYNLTYDLLITPEHLPNAINLAGQFPQVKFVVDHLAKPAIALREMGAWAAQMAELAQMRNVYCKFSGMLTEGGTGSTQEDIQFYFNFLHKNFGAERIMFGSDWPVMTLGGTYAHWLDWVKQTISVLSEKDQQAIMSENTLGFYTR